MLSFASEFVSHVASVDSNAKKERKKRARKEQLRAEADKLELVTKALEVFTLMHLTEPWIANHNSVSYQDYIIKWFEGTTEIVLEEQSPILGSKSL